MDNVAADDKRRQISSTYIKHLQQLTDSWQQHRQQLSKAAEDELKAYLYLYLLEMIALNSPDARLSIYFMSLWPSDHTAHHYDGNSYCIGIGVLTKLEVQYRLGVLAFCLQPSIFGVAFVSA